MLFKKIRNKLIAIVVTMGVMALPIFSGTALAKPLEKNKQPIILNVTAEQEVIFKDKTLNSESYKQLGKRYEFESNQVLVKQLPRNYDGMKMVYIPIKDNTGYNYSKYIQFYDKNGYIKNSLLLVFTKKENNIYHMQTELNNGTKAEADITEKGAIVSGSVIGADGISKDINSFISSSNTDKGPGIIATLFGVKNAYAGAGFGCLNNCLASCGVAAWVISSIGVVCAMACAVTLGVGCYVCIAACGLGLGGVLDYCLEDCGYGY